MSTKADSYEFYVGEQSSMEGAEMTITGTARIDGRLVGKIHADHLIVGKSGFVSGTISGDSAEVQGVLEQSINVGGKLKIMSGGRVSGEISYGSIDVDEGAQLTGTVSSTASQTASAGDGNRERLDQLSAALATDESSLAGEAGETDSETARETH